MKKLLFAASIMILFMSGCSTSPSTPLPQPSRSPTLTLEPLPTEPQRTITPELLLEIRNDPDPLRTPYGIALDSTGNIYVNDAGNSRVLVFDKEGILLAAWDKHGSGEGEFKSLGFGGIAIDRNDNVFVVDNGNYRVQKFDANGKFLTGWGSQGRGDGQFVRAIGIAVDREGNVYVTDDGNPFVQKFDNNGRFLMKWGGDGMDDGKFRHATGIAVDGQGKVFVSDYEKKRLQKFDKQGTFMTAWGLGADINRTGIPEGIAVDDQGRVYVTDYMLGRIEVFANDGKWLQVWGAESLTKSLFHRPVAIAFDARGHFYVVNQGTSLVQMFNLP